MIAATRRAISSWEVMVQQTYERLLLAKDQLDNALMLFLDCRWKRQLVGCL